MSDGIKALIIDDDKISSRILKRVLEKEGLGVILASSGEEGRRLAKEFVPDLIFLDISMPDENGFETLIKLDADVVTHEIPVIFISSHDKVQNKVKGFEIGAVDYITKPFEPMEVIARARVHLRLSLAKRVLIENQKAQLKGLSKAQEAILVRPEDHPEAHFSVLYKPILDVGGDFYDALPFGNEVFGYFCADVSGHDLASSFATSALKAVITQSAGPLYEPRETMQMINNVLGPLLAQGIYLTLSYCLLNRKSNILKVVSAGHPPVIIQRKDGPCEVVDVPGDVIGIFKKVSFETRQIEVQPGDRFYMYTDGLIEIGKSLDRETGIDNLGKLLCRNRNIPIEEATKVVVKELFPAGTVIEDDVLLLGVEV